MAPSRPEDLDLTIYKVRRLGLGGEGGEHFSEWTGWVGVDTTIARFLLLEAIECGLVAGRAAFCGWIGLGRLDRPVP